VVKTEDKGVEFIPFGSQDKVKLTISMIKNLVAIKTRSGKTCSDNDAIKFVAMCQARRLNPFEGDAYLIGYDGREGATFSLITAHQAFLKRAELNAEYDGMKSGIIVKDEEGAIRDLEGDFYLDGQEILGGWATVYFKNRKQPMQKRVRLKRFQKSFGVWQDDPAGMICKCAEADALRSSFPTMLGGLYLKEEIQAQPDSKVSAPIFTEAPKAETSEPETVDAQTIEPEQELKKEPLMPGRKSRPGKNPSDESSESFESAPAETHPAVHDTSKPEGSGEYNLVKAVKGFFEIAGIKPEKVIQHLKKLGSIEDSINTLEEVAIQSPDVMELLHKHHDDMIARIKGEK
jgi:phage recombination protein Bet